MKTLILVDIQNDFLPGGSLAVPDGDKIIPIVNTLQSSFDVVVATQDWHPADHLSFASNYEGKKPFDTIILHGSDQVLWPDHCVQGSRGAEFHHDLQMNSVEAIFRKGMVRDIDSYSGFYDNDHRKSTGLAGYLRDRQITEVYVCGLAADYCVFYTVMDALREKFKVWLIEDATRPIDQEDFNSKKKEIRENGGEVIHSTVLV